MATLLVAAQLERGPCARVAALAEPSRPGPLELAVAVGTCPLLAACGALQGGFLTGEGTPGQRRPGRGG